MKVALLLSGGVDSLVAGLLLKEKGYDLLGLTMVNWDEKVVKKAREAAQALDIEHKIVDLRKSFEANVINYFCQSYEKGETPNPCIECNKYIKFGELIDIAAELGCQKVASGHYAQIEFSKEQNCYLLKKGIDKKKDQSYFLYGLKQEQLARILFPLGIFKKEEVKEIARQNNFQVADSKESQEICFIEDNYRDFLEDKILCSSGEVLDLDKKLLGRHRGLPFYTIGQRKGLGISGGRPLYVVDMDMQRNILVLGDEEKLYKTALNSVENNFILTDKIENSLDVEAKIRYAARPAPARIRVEGSTVRVEFKKPQRAITKGQSVVFYQGDYVIGGGVISRVES